MKRLVRLKISWLLLRREICLRHHRRPWKGQPQQSQKHKEMLKESLKAKAKAASNMGKNKKVKDGDKPTLKRPAAAAKAEPKKGQGSSSKGGGCWAKALDKGGGATCGRRAGAWPIRVRNVKSTRRTRARTPSSKSYLRNANFQVKVLLFSSKRGLAQVKAVVNLT